MQCHGVLKGPLRRIIRSLGNERWHLTGRDSAAESHVHQTPSATSHSPLHPYPTTPPERCRPTHHQQQRTLESPRRPRPRHLPGPHHRPSRPYTTTTNTLPPDESPLKAEAREDRPIDGNDDPKLAPSRSKPLLDDASHRPNAPPSNGAVFRRTLTDASVKDTDDFSQRYRAACRRSLIGRSEGHSRAYEIQKERHDYASSDDWRVALRMLDDNTAPGQKLYTKRLETVSLPRGVLARFHDTAGVSIRVIMENTGCHVQVARGSRSSKNAGVLTALDLLGFPSQISHALEILPRYLHVLSAEGLIKSDASSNLKDHHIERRVRSDEEMRAASLSEPETNHRQHYGPLDEENVEPLEHELHGKEGCSRSVATPLRSVWAEERTRKWNMYDALHQRPRPLYFSNPLQLSAYVADLCQYVPRSARETLGKTIKPFSQHGHVQIVIKKLVDLFSAPDTARMVTSQAVDRAISFLTGHSNFAAYREVFRELEDGGYQFTASNWNCCLAAAAKIGDVHNYRYTLTMMLRSNVKPTPSTWATLHDLMCRRFPLEAEFVVKHMRDKGLLCDHGAAKQIAQSSVSNDLKRHLTLGADLATFFKFYDNRFSSVYDLENFEWLSVDVVNRMTHDLLTIGRTEDAFTVLEEFHRRSGERPRETVTLNTFLTSALRDMDAASAVATLKYFRIGQPGAIVPNSVTYSILFAIAWRRRYFNMIRVIWRYACTSGHVDYSMRFRVKKSLKYFLLEENAGDGENKSRGRVWSAFAGKFAIGIRYGHKTTGTRTSRLGRQFLESVHMGDDVEEGSQRPEEKRKSDIRRVFEDDRKKVALFRPVLPLAELLQSAWKKDRDWKERGTGGGESFTEGMFEDMLKDGIEVPMERGDGMLETRSWEVPALLRRTPNAHWEGSALLRRTPKAHWESSALLRRSPKAAGEE
jgi:hypothetical protein